MILLNNNLKIKLYLSLLILVLPFGKLLAQNYLFDAETKKPIASAHLAYANNGLITNDDGYFQIPNINKSDSLLITHILYESKHIALKNLIKTDTIFLNRVAVTLDEVVLKNFQTRDTILKAINSIDKNYLRVPHNSFGFFRQSLQENNVGIEMVEVDFISYNNYTSNEFSTKIDNAKRTENFSQIDFDAVGGVLTVIEKGDFVRRKSYFLNPNEINNYHFSYEGVSQYLGKQVYKIGFRPKDQNNLRYIRKGTLYITKKSLAFVEIDYEFDEKKLEILTQKAKGAKRAKNDKLRVLKGIKNVIRYNLIDGNKFVLSSVEAKSNSLIVFKNMEFIYTLKAKFVANNIKVKNVVKVKTNYNSNRDFSKAIRKYSDSDGWSDNYKLSLSNTEKRILKEINENN